jgi:hypothetical protein
MNKRQIVASLNKIANELDTNGLFNEANEVTEVMVKISQSLIGNSSFGAGGNVPLGIDPSIIPTMPKSYEALGPHQNTGKQNREYAGYKKNFQGKNPMQYSGYVSPEQKAMAAKDANQWINSMSAIHGGDINTMLEIAKEAKAEPGKTNAEKKLLNDVIYILNLRTNKGLGAVRKQDANPSLGPSVGLT